MTKVAENPETAPVEFADDVRAIADYVRSAEGREVIARGLADIREGRNIEDKDALKVELTRRAAARRLA